MHLDAKATLALLTAGGGEPYALLHLLDCPFCRSQMRDLLGPSGPERAPDPALEESARRILALAVPKPSDDPHAYDFLDGLGSEPSSEAQRITEIEERGGAGSLAAETELAAAAFAELLKLSPEDQELRIADPQFRSLAFIHHLLDRAEDADEPDLCFRYSNLALAILEPMDPDSHVFRLRARALCLIASAQRRQGLIDVASDTLLHTAQLLGAEPLGARSRVLFCAALAAVRIDQRRVDEALALLERASLLADLNGDWLELARARLAQGWLLIAELDHDEALVVLREAYVLTDPSIHPHLAFSILHALALTYADLGQTAELKGAVLSLKALRPYLPGRIPELRIRWIEAQTIWRLGETTTAINRMRRVLSGLIDEGSAVDAAVAALEVARWAMEHPPYQTKLLGELLETLRPLAEDGRLHPWLWDVVSFSLSFARHGIGFHQNLLLSALRYVQRADFNPNLPFEPLQDVDVVVDWSEIPKAARETAADTAGLQLVDHMPAVLEDRTHLAWAYEALTGERVRFLGRELQETQN